MTNKRFIALSGNIGCGKTTAAKLISRHFGFELFDEPVIDNRFDPLLLGYGSVVFHASA